MVYQILNQLMKCCYLHNPVNVLWNYMEMPGTTRVPHFPVFRACQSKETKCLLIADHPNTKFGRRDLEISQSCTFPLSYEDYHSYFK